ncbi:hypothetical protein J422_06972 [Methanocaldococcus villosus KIN24-T80]|uniref:Sjogrens syndrome scleroderma autoantigen 1 n=1 Tax=Methanocaldococcus villosus KIN24-T80 TaxID=1069083 RepID=N6VR46_9EURY|nr:Sjogren's syndrome/scleroderma autoantigen 1 family protein [Methanocaldococcus villosus]ENN95596.1 hypothetical protein J422_06972 [Methanocaldococcus villosus KIN24-T80]
MDPIKITSEELLKGAKMLSKHCEKCGFPLFEKDGKIYCAICNKSNLEDSHKLDKNDIIDKKIDYLLEKLKNENEISRIKEIGEAIAILIKIKKELY